MKKNNTKTKGTKSTKSTKSTKMNLSTANAYNNIKSGLTPRKHIYISNQITNNPFYVDFKYKNVRYYLGTFKTLLAATRARNLQYRTLGINPSN
jgi:hypothetical protein